MVGQSGPEQGSVRVVQANKGEGGRTCLLQVVEYAQTHLQLCHVGHTVALHVTTTRVPRVPTSHPEGATHGVAFVIVACLSVCMRQSTRALVLTVLLVGASHRSPWPSSTPSAPRSVAAAGRCWMLSASRKHELPRSGLHRQRQLAQSMTKSGVYHKAAAAMLLNAVFLKQP